MRIPNLDLTHGQALYALTLGQKPETAQINQLRHLRRLGVPFAEGEGRGQGNQVRYDFERLIETGAAMFALRNHMPPRHIANWFAAKRNQFHKNCREAWRSLPEAAFDPKALEKRSFQVRSDEIYLRLHDRYTQKPGMFDFAKAGDVVDVLKEGLVGERFDDQQFRPMLALKTSMMRWVYWAQKAPVIRTGPRT